MARNQKMNLGVIYINTFIDITLSALAIALVTTILIRLLKNLSILFVFAMFLGLSLVFVYFGNDLYLEQMFVHRHKAQNIWVPQDGCITYEPSPGDLFASYSMSRDEFDNWVGTHPFQLSEGGGELLDFDTERLGFTTPDVIYETEMAPNGKQLRVYFKDGTMYLSYNVM